LICIGKITKAHGIHGEVKIIAYSGDPSPMKEYPQMAFEDRHHGSVEKGESLELHTISRCRIQGKYAIVAFENVTTRNRAEDLVGTEVWVNKELLPDLQDDEFYWYDIEGMTVVSDDGKPIGTITKIFATGAHDIIVVRQGRDEFFIPARDEFVSNIDRDKRVVTVKPVPGLLEMNL